MKKKQIRKPDGRYLIYYTFDPSELAPVEEKWRAEARPHRKHRKAKRGAKGRGR